MVYQIDLYIFTTATTFPFAGKNTSIPKNSVKYMISVESWPFRSNRNKLQIIMATEASSQNEDDCETTEISTDSSNNVQWFKLNIGEVSLYLPKQLENKKFEKYI